MCKSIISGMMLERVGGAGKLELYEYMKAPAYTATEPFMHITNLYHVFNASGSKVGEFHTVNGRISFQGVAEDVEVQAICLKVNT